MCSTAPTAPRALRLRRSALHPIAEATDEWFYPNSAKTSTPPPGRSASGRAGDVTPQVCLAFCGDGSTSRADFHEALTIASVQSLPNVFVIENNQYSYSTPLPLTSHSETLSVEGRAYGIPGVTVDGTDVLAVHDAVAEAVGRARAGDGPSIVEGITMRMHGHAEHDPADYVVKELYEEYAKKDPVELFERGVRRGHGL
jgi:TPP-dependent pyruvate/acetoin dehydrogenase alpha subunit